MRSHAPITRQRVVTGLLALAIFMAVAACQPISPATTNQATKNNAVSTSASGRNHVPAGERPQWVTVTFTASASYKQARALILSVGETPYPWSCNPLYDETPSPVSGQYAARPVTTPPPSPLQDTPAVFAATHFFILSYPAPDHLDQLAASDLVASIDVAHLTHCQL